MKVKSRRGPARSGGAPVGDEAAVGDLGLFGELAFAGAFGALAVGVVGREVTPSGVALGAGAQLETAELLAGQRRALERVVLLAREEVPEQHGELARDGDDRDLAASARADALVERAHRTGGAHGDERGLGEHLTDRGGALLGDPAVARSADPGLAHLWVKAEVADQLARLVKAAYVADGGDERRRGHQAHAGHGHQALDRLGAERVFGDAALEDRDLSVEEVDL